MYGAFKGSRKGERDIERWISGGMRSTLGWNWVREIWEGRELVRLGTGGEEVLEIQVQRGGSRFGVE